MPAKATKKWQFQTRLIFKLILIDQFNQNRILFCNQEELSPYLACILMQNVETGANNISFIAQFNLNSIYILYND